MNYSKRGIKARQKAVHATSTRLGKKLLVSVLNLSLLFILSVGVIGISMGFGIFKGVIDTAPSIENIKVTPTGFSTFVYDLEGNQTAKLVSQNSNRIPVTHDMIPQDLADAFVAIEDERFYEHNGIDIKGIIRAAYIGVSQKFHFTEGASTITQQLLKNNVFTDWTSETGFADKLKRKIQEQYLAIELSKSMSKEDVLLNYMNSINLGQNTLGVQAASLRYFDKPVNELNLSECAVIASITQNPSRLNPISHPEDNAKRRKKVLDNMLDQEYISRTEYDEAMADDVYSRIQIANEGSEDSTVNTYFVDSLTTDVMDDLLAAGYNETQAFTLLYSGGLKIYSTQDPNIQAICDEIFSNEENYPADTRWQLSYALTIKKSSGDYENHSTEMLQSYFKEQNPSFNLIFNSHEDAYAQIEEYKLAVLESGDEVFDENVTLTPQPQVSLTIEDQHTGYILAMVGGRGPKEASRTLNRATDAKRQPGSTFKTVAVYAPAFDSAGLTLATVINDAPFNYADGRPVNNWWGSSYRGLNSLRQGIIDSMNILAVKTLTIITPQLGFDYVKNFGFTTVVDRKEVTVNGETQIFSDIQQSLALGGLTVGVTNEELNAAYAAIANGGTYIKPKLYTKVVDHDGNVILDNTQPESRQVIKETTAWLLTNAMMDVVIQGTGASCNFGNMAIAGKTGTTSAYNDVWFAGYTPYYTATTWTGYDNNTKLRKGEERSLAKKLWRAVMSRIHEDLPSASFPMPSSGIVQATVCARSGKLPIAGLCDGTLRTEYFAEGTVPTESCDVHYRGLLCQYNGLPACEGCPFAVEGVRELIPIEHPSLQQGSVLTQQITNEDGTVSVVPIDPNQSNTCPHNAEFMAQPGIEGIIEQQRNEILAAQQAAMAANEGAPPPAENAAPPDDSNGGAE
ncbi:glycosyl transferase [bacterium 1xD8-48]|jgi:penicillin-binding protein 1A|nr:glycosyl transferase [Lachnospiraceae bacterium]MCI9327899.1 glycosyl transferase [Lachnospiraceae bacterium]NBJ99012.1 glycosyl transferase [bacterium 1xD8-48]